MVGKADIKKIPYTITIDHSQSLGQMIAAGCYDCVGDDINDKNFPKI